MNGSSIRCRRLRQDGGKICNCQFNSYHYITKINTRRGKRRKKKRQKNTFVKKCLEMEELRNQCDNYGFYTHKALFFSFIYYVCSVF